jgi:CDP-diacylglycerol--serine O-phosphatidyltransferase
VNGSAARYLHGRNLLTYLSLLAGLGAIASAKAIGSWSAAGALIALSALADTFDGRFARLFARSGPEQEFGVQLDSLTDAVTFGLVPVVALDLLLSFDSPAQQVAWWAAAFFYVVSAITRLGFYNLHHEATTGFVGLPTTVAGLIWSSAFLVRPSAPVSLVLLVACGIAMVSRLPVPRPRGFGMVGFVMWALLLVGLHGAAAGSRPGAP